MKTLFNTNDTNEIIERLNTLTHSSPRQWGKMDVAQMLAHSTHALWMASGEINPPRSFIGKLIGGFIKPIYSNEKPFDKNCPTDPHIKITDQHDFEKEKTALFTAITKFHSGGKEKASTHPHPFFGKLTADEWGTGMYKHLDHHFRQFGA